MWQLSRSVLLPHALSWIALLLYSHEAHLSHRVMNISSAEKDVCRDRVVRDIRGREDVRAQDGDRNHETAEDDSRLCAAYHRDT